jgi:hypothetical protein
MKPLLTALILFLSVTASIAAEEGGEQAAKKPPPKPRGELPVAAVMKLPAVMKWKQWVDSHEGQKLTALGESLKTVDNHNCWSIAVGEERYDGLHIWRRFCVPQEEGEVLVESINATPDDENTTFTPYTKWVIECKPTDSFEGNC